MHDPYDRFVLFLNAAVEAGATDLHLSADTVPFVRINGELQMLVQDSLSAGDVDALARSLMHSRQVEEFEREQTLDMGFSDRLGNRYRVNVFRERDATALAVRRLSDRFHTFEELHLPRQLASLADLRDGLVLITGPTGSGKSTTLATLIHKINRSRSCHIITIEDPIEYVHVNDRSLVHQRQLYSDVPSFAHAVRAALREDPDVILVGEMRDVETMRAAISAAETGHLVFSTLHTGDAVGVLDRVLGMFSGSEQDAVRQQLSMVLRGVVAQRLLRRQDNGGRVPAVEYLKVTTAVSHLIRVGKPQQIYSSIETGATLGMQTFEQSLASLVKQGLVEEDDARRMSRDSKLFEDHLRAQKRGAYALTV